MLILGTGSGDVLALDVSAGQMKWRVSDCHPGCVSCFSVVLLWYLRLFKETLYYPVSHIQLLIYCQKKVCFVLHNFLNSDHWFRNL